MLIKATFACLFKNKWLPGDMYIVEGADLLDLKCQ